MCLLCHNTEGSNPHFHYRGNLKSSIIFIIYEDFFNRSGEVDNIGENYILINFTIFTLHLLPSECLSYIK
jgi:hypothetical protein